MVRASSVGGPGSVLPRAKRRQRGVQIEILARLLVDLHGDQFVGVMQLRRGFAYPVQGFERRAADGRRWADTSAVNRTSTLR